MARVFLYFSLPLLYLICWSILLLTGYSSFVGNDPFMLDGTYLLAFATNKSKILFSELLFPLAMVLAFMITFIIKLSNRPIRPVLGLFSLLSFEFFCYRQFIFPDQYANYHHGFESGVPMEMTAPSHYLVEMVMTGLIFVLIVILRESAPPRHVPLAKRTPWSSGTGG